jgi:hypothetical protein
LSHDSESEIEELMNPNDELNKKIVTLANNTRIWNNISIKASKSFKTQFEEILDLGLNKYKMEKNELRRLIEQIFLFHGVSESWLRKLLPVELKDSSKTRISYQQRQNIEKERQRLLQQRALESHHESDTGEYDNHSGSLAESASYPPTELVPTTSSLEMRQDLETQYTENNSPLSEVSSPSSITMQNEPKEANKRIERLEKEVQWLSKPFTTKAYLQAADQDILLIAKIDPVKKPITSIQIDKSY